MGLRPVVCTYSLCRHKDPAALGGLRFPCAECCGIEIRSGHLASFQGAEMRLHRLNPEQVGHGSNVRRTGPELLNQRIHEIRRSLKGGLCDLFHLDRASAAPTALRGACSA